MWISDSKSLKTLPSTAPKPVLYQAGWTGTTKVRSLQKGLTLLRETLRKAFADAIGAPHDVVGIHKVKRKTSERRRRLAEVFICVDVPCLVPHFAETWHWINICFLFRRVFRNRISSAPPTTFKTAIRCVLKSSRSVLAPATYSSAPLATWSPQGNAKRAVLGVLGPMVLQAVNAQLGPMVF